ncbi:MAG: type II toxin-antitoxin system RelE/ParE family toxin [Kiritimatiellae bacterium]|nr:type II toxin-antitoxin system RelE/ParE family toxin [Kiritimatiellia bacterium]
MTVKLHEQARLDIKRGVAIYDAQSLGLGSYFQTMVIAAIDSLQFFPALHPVIRGYRRMLIDKFPFAAYYKIYKDMVVVFSVLDTRMDPGTINSRLDSLS